MRAFGSWLIDVFAWWASGAWFEDRFPWPRKQVTREEIREALLSTPPATLPLHCPWL